MKKRLIFAVIFSIVLVFSACEKTSETAKLESRISKLESEVENLKNQPATTPSKPALKDEKTSSFIMRQQMFEYHFHPKELHMLLP